MKIHTVQLHLGDLIEGTQDMDNGEYGAYVRIFLSLYNQPDQTSDLDPTRLARIAACSPKEWRRVRDKVLSKFEKNDQKITHIRVKNDVEKYHKKSVKNKSNALKRYETDLPNAMPNDSQTPATQDPRPKTQDKIKKKGSDEPRVIAKVALPDWLPENAWNDLVKYRGKSFTQKARNLALTQLEEWNQQGHDLTKIINTTIMNGWKGLFEPKNGGKNGKELTGHAALASIGRNARSAIDQQGQQVTITAISNPERTGLLAELD